MGRPLRAVSSSALAVAALALLASGSPVAGAQTGSVTQELRATVASSALGWAHCGRPAGCVVGAQPLHVRRAGGVLTLSH